MPSAALQVITASSALDGLLLDLSCVAEQAAGELGVDRFLAPNGPTVGKVCFKRF